MSTMRGLVAALLLAGLLFAEPITVTVEPWSGPSIEEGHDRLRTGRDAGYPAFLWFAAQHSPFDSFGPVGGVFTVGLAPEPSDLLLLVAGAVALAAECRPRKSPRLRGCDDR